MTGTAPSTTPTGRYPTSGSSASTTPARKRELIEPDDRDRHYIRRDAEGHFTEDQVDVGRSLSQDRKRRAKRTVPAGQGDKGDRKKS